MGKGFPRPGVDLFQQIIIAWRKRPDRDEPLAPNQIAFITLGNGSPQHAAIVGRTLWEFRAYFYAPPERGRKWRVNWPNVHRDCAFRRS